MTESRVRLERLSSVPVPKRGMPSDEFVTPRFDPAAHLRRHLAGEPAAEQTPSARVGLRMLQGNDTT